MLPGTLFLLVLPVKEATDSAKKEDHAERNPEAVALPGRRQLLAAKLLVYLAVEGFVVDRLDRQESSPSAEGAARPARPLHQTASRLSNRIEDERKIGSTPLLPRWLFIG
jgi:hypothetical protein